MRSTERHDSTLVPLHYEAVRQCSVVAELFVADRADALASHEAPMANY